MAQLLLTASQAYPAFEKLVAEVRSEVRVGMRIFDVATPLYGDADMGSVASQCEKLLLDIPKVVYFGR